MDCALFEVYICGKCSHVIGDETSRAVEEGWQNVTYDQVQLKEANCSLHDQIHSASLNGFTYKYNDVKCVCGQLVGAYCSSVPDELVFLKNLYVLDTSLIKRHLVDWGHSNEDVVREVNDRLKELEQIVLDNASVAMNNAFQTSKLKEMMCLVSSMYHEDKTQLMQVLS